MPTMPLLPLRTSGPTDGPNARSIAGPIHRRTRQKPQACDAGSPVRGPQVAALLALLLGLTRTVVAAPALVEDSMAQRMAPCTLCHGKSGVAAPDGFRPRIAGKPAGYLANQLMNFRDGRRHYGPMVRLMEPLSDGYVREIAAYFASLDLPYPPPAANVISNVTAHRGEQLARQGDAAAQLPACSACHGTALTGVLPATPGLLGLPRDYLVAQLGAWQTGLRRAHEPDCMAQIARQMKPDDIAAVSAWLALQPVPTQAKAAAQAPVVAPLRCGNGMGVATAPAAGTASGATASDLAITPAPPASPPPTPARTPSVTAPRSVPREGS